MFGNKKKLTWEEIQKLQDTLEEGKAFLDEMAKQQDLFASDSEAIAQSREQLSQDVEQAALNSRDVLTYARQNAKQAAALSDELEEKRLAAQKALEEYKDICNQIEKQRNGCCQAVEQNKHFTTPSKILGELPAELAAQKEAYLEELDRMESFGKQMSVLSLNAAIEAGRMGEAAKGFVGAAEEVRSCARQYEQAVVSLKEKLAHSDEQLKILDENIRYIISLLKDNNVATAKLMRDCEALQKNIEHSFDFDFSEDFTKIREELIGMKNAEDEIIKAEERNQMQFDDIRGEVESQQLNGQEIADEWGKIYQSALVYRGKL